MAREPLLVPHTKPLNLLLRAFQQRRNHMALVLNEYGGIDGIVTLEDVLEEIVGEIIDESDRPEEGIEPRPDGSIVVNAETKTRKVLQHLNLSWSPDSGAMSVGGLIGRELDRVPERGDVVEWRGLRFEVLSATSRHPLKVRIRPVPAGGEE
jgi:CBS domain containing-hemolysin-like protein